MLRAGSEAAANADENLNVHKPTYFPREVFAVGQIVRYRAGRGGWKEGVVLSITYRSIRKSVSFEEGVVVNVLTAGTEVALQDHEVVLSSSPPMDR